MSKMSSKLLSHYGVTIPQAEAIAKIILSTNNSTKGLIKDMDIGELATITKRLAFITEELNKKQQEQTARLKFRQQVCDVRAVLRKEKVETDEFVAYLKKHHAEGVQ